MKKRRFVYSAAGFAVAITSLVTAILMRDYPIGPWASLIALVLYSRSTYWQGRINGSKLTVKDREAVADAGYAEGWNDAIEEMKRRRGLR